MKENLSNYFTTFNIEDGFQNISARYIFLHTFIAYNYAAIGK